MRVSEKIIDNTRKRLSSERFRTLAEIRPDLPDGRWSELPPQVAEEWGKVRRALNALVAFQEVEVRVRRVRTDVTPGGGRRCLGRQEYRLVPPGGRRAKKWESGSLIDPVPQGAL